MLLGPCCSLATLGHLAEFNTNKAMRKGSLLPAPKLPGGDYLLDNPDVIQNMLKALSL